MSGLPAGGVSALLILAAVALLPVDRLVAQPTAVITITETEEPLTSRYHKLVVDHLALGLDRLGYSSSEEAPTIELRVEATIFEPRMHLSISAVDNESRAVIAGVNGSARTNVTLLNSLDELFAKIAPELERHRDRITAEEDNPFVGRPEVRRLRFTGDPEVSVEVLHGPSLGVLREGSLEVTSFPVTEGSEVGLRFSKAGAYPESLLLEIDRERNVITVPELRYRDRLGVQLHYTLGKVVGAGAGIRYYALPDRLFSSVETDLFFSGVAPAAPYRVLHNEYRLLLGARIGPASFPLRFDISSGAGVFFSVPLVGTATPFLDPYISVANLGVEAQIGSFRPFLRGGAVYAIGGRFALLEQGINPMLLSPSILGGVRVAW